MTSPFKVLIPRACYNQEFCQDYCVLFSNSSKTYWVECYCQYTWVPKVRFILADFYHPKFWQLLPKETGDSKFFAWVTNNMVEGSEGGIYLDQDFSNLFYFYLDIFDWGSITVINSDCLLSQLFSVIVNITIKTG